MTSFVIKSSSIDSNTRSLHHHILPFELIFKNQMFYMFISIKVRPQHYYPWQLVTENTKKYTPRGRQYFRNCFSVGGHPQHKIIFCLCSLQEWSVRIDKMVLRDTFIFWFDFFFPLPTCHMLLVFKLHFLIIHSDLYLL